MAAQANETQFEEAARASDERAQERAQKEVMAAKTEDVTTHKVAMAAEQQAQREVAAAKAQEASVESAARAATQQAQAEVAAAKAAELKSEQAAKAAGEQAREVAGQTQQSQERFTWVAVGGLAIISVLLCKMLRMQTSNQENLSQIEKLMLDHSKYQERLERYDRATSKILRRMDQPLLTTAEKLQGA
eukprot:gnl/TRDRNA2_/TRDRNA2_175224_c0_seq2.p1 gnl/TRDRNA2_/TRDRNA2_175224_c0~~gnl/TRDRNA2_/TRDRNA2_175224_c0_seq2.p1  ORF type:complete len:214 (+),score=63.13 gnl/TRDRNA2_/TRDRNA2_175224_c0_seq2:77-643(+)